MQLKGSSAAPSGTYHFGWCDLRYNWDAPSPVFYTGKSIASAFFHSDRVRGRRVTCDALLSCTPEGFFKEENMLIIHFPLPDSCRFETTGFKACVSNLHASTTFLDAPSLCLTLNRPRKLIYWCSVHPFAPLGLREGGGSETVERLSRVKSDFFQHM